MRKHRRNIVYYRGWPLLTFFLLSLFLQGESMAAASVSGIVSYPGAAEQVRIIISKYAGGPGTLTSVIANSDGSYYAGGLNEPVCYAKTWTDPKVSYLVVQYYNLQDYRNDADSITLTDGEVTDNIDFQLKYGGGFSGTVRNNIEPVANVSITLHEEQCNNSQTVTVFSDENGEFLVRGVPVGNYYMKLSSGGSYWWLAEDGSTVKDCQASAPVMEITSQVTTEGFDIVLGLGSVTGIVKNRDNDDPLAGVYMWLKTDACSSDGSILSSTGTDGRYRFANVEAGTYYLLAAGGERRYWVNSSPEGTLVCGNASMITVEDGIVTENIDMSVLPPGSVSGTVSDRWGNPLYEKVQVEFYLNPCDQLTFLGTAYRHNDGFYQKDGLPVGNIYLYARSWGEEDSMWWHNDDSSADQCLDALPVPVLSNQVTTDMDFILSIPGQQPPVLQPLYMLLFN